MPTPFISGDASIAHRWLSGSATVLWAGDSIGAALEGRLMQVLRVTPAGRGVPGANYSGLGAPAWCSGSGGGGLGVTGLLTEKNYSPFASREAVFNGSAVPATGAPAGLNSRLFSDSGEPSLLATRTSLYFAAADWLGSAPNPTLRCILYRNANSANGIIRNYLRGSSSSSVEKGTGSWLNLYSASPAWLADDIPFTAPAGGEDLYLESQSFEGAAPVNATNFILCCALVRSGAAGFTLLPASNGGWSVLTWLDTTKISDGALAAVLPLLGVTDIVISIGQNNPGETAPQFQSSLQQLAARFRAAVPTASIIFLPTYDTNNAGSAPHLAGFADSHYAAQQATPNSCFLNLYAVAGPFAQNNALGYFSDGVHPTAAGAIYFCQTIQGLLDALIVGDATIATGRYASRTDIELLFGQLNIATWSQFDGSPVPNVPRIQRALDVADATIDDFFRDGPYASPLQLGASASTVTNWAATIAGAWLYRSRNAGTASAGASASLTLSPGIVFSASLASPASDPVYALLAEVRAQMSQCKSGTLRIDAAPAHISASTAAIVVG
jgi:hypothetical protein